MPMGGAADVVVTDGFSGNLVLKGIEAAVLALGRQVRTELAEAAADSDAGAGEKVAELVAAAVRRAAARFRPEARGGAVVLGVDGVAVVGQAVVTGGGGRLHRDGGGRRPGRPRAATAGCPRATDHHPSAARRSQRAGAGMRPRSFRLLRGSRRTLPAQVPAGRASHPRLSEDAAFAVIRDAIVAVLEVPATDVARETRLVEDLHADSLALVEIVELVEERLAEDWPGLVPESFRLQDAGLEELQTVGDAVTYAVTSL